MNITNQAAGQYNQPRVLTMQDISCLGRCSLTVALPILSAAGIEAAILPTAILSTHTGSFTDYTFRDLTEDIGGIINHWDSLGVTFNAVSTGYLGSLRQLDLAGEIFDKYKSAGAVTLVDPVMADFGRMYSGFSPEFPKGMARLCAKADIISPNLTEAAFLLGEPFAGVEYDRAYVEGILHRLHKLGTDKVVLTGVSFSESEIGAACLENGEISFCFAEKYPGAFHGTGDIFASILLAAYVATGSLRESAETAVGLTAECIRITIADGVPENMRHYGVHFEKILPMLGDLAIK